MCVCDVNRQKNRGMQQTCSTVGGGCLGESPGVTGETDELPERLFMNIRDSHGRGEGGGGACQSTPDNRACRHGDPSIESRIGDGDYWGQAGNMWPLQDKYESNMHLVKFTNG